MKSATTPAILLAVCLQALSCVFARDALACSRPVDHPRHVSSGLGAGDHPSYLTPAAACAVASSTAAHEIDRARLFRLTAHEFDTRILHRLTHQRIAAPPLMDRITLMRRKCIPAGDPPA